jgi:hypothetical protein
MSPPIAFSAKNFSLEPLQAHLYLAGQPRKTRRIEPEKETTPAATPPRSSPLYPSRPTSAPAAQRPQLHRAANNLLFALDPQGRKVPTPLLRDMEKVFESKG